MRLYKYEFRKALFSKYGIVLLLICIVGKAFLLFLIPEAKDPRIRLSQKQYDNYLKDVYGEDSDEKRSRIIQEYEDCIMIINSWQEMSSRYNQGKLDDKGWKEYVNLYDRMTLRKNALEIFSETAYGFEETPDNVASPFYIYEYGWITVYKWMQFPDLFFLIFTIFFSVDTFSVEVRSGMREIILSSKNGRKELYVSKLVTVVSVLMISAVLFAAEEWVIFELRGFLNDRTVPIYSIAVFSGKCFLKQSLVHCLIGSLFLRGIGMILIGSLIMATTVVYKKVGTTFVTAIVYIIIVTVLSLFGWNSGLIFHGCLLCPTNSFIAVYKNGCIPLIPACIVCFWSITYVFLVGCRYNRRG